MHAIMPGPVNMPAGHFLFLTDMPSFARADMAVVHASTTHIAMDMPLLPGQTLGFRTGDLAASDALCNARFLTVVNSALSISLAEADSKNHGQYEE